MQRTSSITLTPLVCLSVARRQALIVVACLHACLADPGTEGFLAVKTFSVGLVAGAIEPHHLRDGDSYPNRFACSQRQWCLAGFWSFAG